MSELPDRLVDQFSERDEGGDIWRAFDLFLPTNAYLNLGYSGRFQTHALGSPQQRLVERIIEEFETLDSEWHRREYLDIGCGRGGAAAEIVGRYEVDVVGVDLVPHNVVLAQAQSSQTAPAPSFVIGDATAIPFCRDSFSGCYAIDSIVYVPDKRALFAELDRILEPGGVCVISDLLVADDPPISRGVIDRFCDAWDMPPLSTHESYRKAIEATDLRIVSTTDLSAWSVGTFRRWTTCYLTIADSPLRGVFDRPMRRYDLDAEAIERQIRAAHHALPALRHTLFAIRTPEG